MTHTEYMAFCQDYQAFRRDVTRWRENLEGASPVCYDFDPLPEIVVRDWQDLNTLSGIRDPRSIRDYVNAIKFAFNAIETDRHRLVVRDNAIVIQHDAEFATNPNLYNELVDLRKSGDYHYPEALEGRLENLIERAAHLNEPRTP